jgi:DNA anti-recombination protein RmuC
MTTTNHLNKMKNKTPFLMLTAAVLIATGCDKKRTTSEKLDNVEAKTAEVAQDIKDYTFAERDEFVRKERAVLADINRDLDELAARVEESTAAVKAEAQPRIEALRERTARLNKQLDDASNTTESGWEKFKAEVREAQAKSKEEFNKARQWLSDKIAP